jgi:hypothetical protein
MKKQIFFNQDIEDVRNKLPKRCAFSTISEMINKEYTPGTIRHMFAQRRTMSPTVLEAAKKLIDFITPETKSPENEKDE